MQNIQITLAILLFAAASCKKSVTPTPPPTQQDSLVITEIIQPGIDTTALWYNQYPTYIQLDQARELGVMIDYQYAGGTVTMLAYSGSVLTGQVVLVKDANGQVDSLRAEKFNPDGSVLSWQDFAYTYSGKNVIKAVSTSNYPGDARIEFDYNYTNGQLRSISSADEPVLKFSYLPGTPSAQGDFFWLEDTVYLPTTYQGPSTLAPLICPIQGQNLCSDISTGAGKTMPVTYTYDASHKYITGFSSILGTFRYGFTSLN